MNIAEKIQLNYTCPRSFNPHNASRQGKLAMVVRSEDRISSHHLNKRSQIHQSVHYLEACLAKEIDKHLLSLNQLSERTGWNRLGYIMYCPRVDQLISAVVSIIHPRNETSN
jgi:hypothetical protein